MLTAYAGGLDFQALLVAAVVIAGLGVLNDVTITQASAVWELRGAAPTMTRRSLFTSAMRIGRDHIASTIYTIVFAYAGTALLLLLVVSLYDRPLLDLAGTDEIATEIVRSLTSSIGLVLAVPLTTVIAALTVPGPRATHRRSRVRQSDPVHYLGIDLAWGLNRPTGLAVLDEAGRLELLTAVRTDDEIAECLAPFVTGPCLAGIDAPLVVTNATGSRPAEQALSKDFRKYEAGAHPSNTGKPEFADGTRGARVCASWASTSTPTPRRSAARSRSTRTPPRSCCSASSGP